MDSIKLKQAETHADLLLDDLIQNVLKNTRDMLSTRSDWGRSQIDASLIMLETLWRNGISHTDINALQESIFAVESKQYDNDMALPVSDGHITTVSETIELCTDDEVDSDDEEPVTRNSLTALLDADISRVNKNSLWKANFHNALLSVDGRTYLIPEASANFSW